jgi:hypothetical protein
VGTNRAVIRKRDWHSISKRCRQLRPQLKVNPPFAPNLALIPPAKHVGHTTSGNDDVSERANVVNRLQTFKGRGSQRVEPAVTDVAAVKNDIQFGRFDRKIFKHSPNACS